MNIKETLEQKVGIGRVVQNKNIFPYLTLRNQTTAEFFFQAESKEDLINVITVARELHFPYMILGGGSNLAVLQSFISGLVIKNLYSKKEIVEETPEYTDILFSSGYPMSRVVTETTTMGLEGFEYQLGLPGTLGGGIYMNSKWTKPLSYIGDNLLSAYLLAKDNQVKKVDKSYFRFAYDYSYLQETKEIVLEAVFRLKKNNPEILKQRSKDALAYRHKTQPFGVATSGCFFQNISLEEKNKLGLETTSAGYLIDQAGLKNTQIGDFIVSDKHANFIINKGAGKPEDLQALLELIKVKVKKRFGVELKEEVRII